VVYYPPFADKAAMERWDNSQESLKLLKEANDYSTRHYDTSTGLETWVTLPDLKTQPITTTKMENGNRYR
jgi:hypothetical protein